MGKTLIPSHLKTHVAFQVKESITESANNAYYVFAGKHTTYANGSIPTPQDSTQSVLYDAFNNMVFGKRISDNDVMLMIPKVEWTANTVYVPYDSNEVVLGEPFYVSVNATSQYDIFKILDAPRYTNGSYVPSLNSPSLNETSPNDTYYSTADGYVWKYMYSVTNTTWNKFATDTWMPVSSNTQVTGNAVSGAIDVIRVSYQGSNYNALYSNSFNASQIQIAGNPYLYDLQPDASSNNDFYTDSALYITSGPAAGEIKKITDYNGAYKRMTISSPFTTTPTSLTTYQITPYIEIDGDGTGAVARGLVNTASSNSIYKVEVIGRGGGYSYATINVRANTGGVSSNGAVIQAMLPPRGGHGSNTYVELGSTALGIGITFSNTESGTIPTTNDFRTIGVLKDPLFANVQLSLNASSVSGVFTIGANLVQANTFATGVIESYIGATLQLTNVAGQFLSGKTVYVAGPVSNVATANVLSYKINNVAKDFTTFDQRYRYVVDYIAGTFIADEAIYQNNIVLANGVYHSNDSTFWTLTDVKGVINADEQCIGVSSGASVNVTGRVVPDLVKYSGDVVYLENFDPVSRSNTQSEQIKIVLKF